jgi:hypothetical protein
MICPFYSLALHLAVVGTPKDSLFSMLSDGGGVSAQINALFRDMQKAYETEDSSSFTKPEIYTKDLTSHSLRRLGINILEEYSGKGIGGDWINIRAGLALDNPNKKSYFDGTPVTDKACGRALSGNN